MTRSSLCHFAPDLPAAPQGAPRPAPQGPTAGMLNVTQHWFDRDMDQWGKTRGQDVHEANHRLSCVLGPDGAPLVYLKPRIGFDLTPRARRQER